MTYFYRLVWLRLATIFSLTFILAMLTPEMKELLESLGLYNIGTLLVATWFMSALTYKTGSFVTRRVIPGIADNVFGALDQEGNIDIENSQLRRVANRAGLKGYDREAFVITALRSEAHGKDAKAIASQMRVDINNAYSTEVYNTCVHEAAHAVVAYHCGFPVVDVYRYGTEGRTTYMQYIKDKTSAWSTIIVGLSGAIAQQLYSDSTFSVGATDDVKEANALLDIYHYSYQTKEDTRESLGETAWREAERMVRAHEPQIMAVAEALRTKSVLNAPDLQKIMRQVARHRIEVPTPNLTA